MKALRAGALPVLALAATVASAEIRIRREQGRLPGVLTPATDEASIIGSTSGE